jgi:hypothetical protein
VVYFNRASGKITGESGTHRHQDSERLNVDRLKDVSVFRVRRLLPLADRTTTVIILPLVVDSAIFGKATGERISILRL